MTSRNSFKHLDKKATEDLRREIQSAVDEAARSIGVDPELVLAQLAPNADTAHVTIVFAGATHAQLAMLEDPVHEILGRLMKETSPDGAKVLLGYSISDRS